MIHQLQSIGVLFCVVLLGWFAAELVRIWETRGDSHLLHGPKDGCPECVDK